MASLESPEMFQRVTSPINVVPNSPESMSGHPNGLSLESGHYSLQIPNMVQVVNSRGHTTPSPTPGQLTELMTTSSSPVPFAQASTTDCTSEPFITMPMSWGMEANNTPIAFSNLTIPEDTQSSVSLSPGSDTLSTGTKSNQQTTLKGKAKRKRFISKDQRVAANVRERRRMITLNSAFDILKQRIPTFTHEKKLSRIETLRLAMAYISFMRQLVSGKDPRDITVDFPFMEDDSNSSEVMKSMAYVLADSSRPRDIPMEYAMDHQAMDHHDLVAQNYFHNAYMSHGQ